MSGIAAIEIPGVDITAAVNITGFSTADIEESLFRAITQDESITAYIGTRFYPINIPLESALPAAAYKQLPSGIILAHSGKLNFRIKRYEITAAATDYETAKNIQKVIKALISGITGNLDGIGVFTQGVRISSFYDSIVSDNPAVFGVVADYDIPHVPKVLPPFSNGFSAGFQGLNP